MEKFLTVCPYCGCGCGLYLHVEGERIVGVSPSRSHPVNTGSLCVKGWNSYEFIQHPDRLRYPLIREDGVVKKVSWKEALRKVADKLNLIRKTYGSDSIGFMSSAKCTNEENYLMMKFARAVLSTNNIDHCARLCHSPSIGGLSVAFGSGAMTNSISEIRSARLLFVIGSNTTEQHPIIAMHILDAINQGATLIVADPRKTQIAGLSYIHLQHRCGTDTALLLSIMNVMVSEKLIDIEFVRKRTENFDAFEELIKNYPPERCQKITGIKPDDIRKVARLYSGEKRSMLFYAMGITQHITGTENVRACADLVMLAGHIGLPMTGLNPLRGQNNVQGASDMGALPDYYSGYQAISDTKVRGKFEKAWKRKLPEKPGLTLTEMLNSVKAMFIIGENPVLSDPDISHVREALRSLDFLVVSEIFPTETTEYADVILPACSFAEKTGTFTNTERRVQLLRKAIEPIGESIPDWQIISRLSALMGYPMNYRGTYEIMEEIALLTPSYGGILHHRLEKGFGLQWPCPDNTHLGTPYLHRKRFTRGLGSFITTDYKPSAELPDEEYPFVLTTGRTYFQYHTGTMTKRTYIIQREEPLCKIEINPMDAEKLGIKDKSMVRVRSRRGEINVSAFITEGVPEGTVFIPFHYSDAVVNLITSPNLDPVAKIPEFKVCAVRLEPI